MIVDALRLKQIYTNILSNAVKYTPDGGNVDVEIFEETRKRKKKIRADREDAGIMESECRKNTWKRMYSKFTVPQIQESTKCRDMDWGFPS